MDTSMRDLEQIQEAGPATDSARRLAVFGMAAGTTLLLIYGVGVVLSSNAAPEPVHDPLAALSASAPLHDAVESVEARESTDPTSLEFHETLVPDSRPEVAAALAAADAELEALGGPLRTAVVTPPPPPTLPAANVVAGTATTLVDTASRDPLVAAALPEVDPPQGEARADEGRDGQYTLQIASFRLEDEAEVFARALRDRGHEAFVVRAEIEGRGVFHRVRVGPFETAGAASRYRRTFEQEERMDSYVVRNRDFDADA
ncbi:MAG: SPOR domain-containing protein [Myxococcota bacterium]